jgi:hypothetical protein
MIDAAGWKNPRWEQTTDPILRQIFDSLERWTKNPTVTTISTPQSTTTATYNAATDQVDRPDPVTIFGDQLVAGQLQSSNYAAGSAGWIINSDGTAEFADVTVRGDLASGTVVGGPLAGMPQVEVTNGVFNVREADVKFDVTTGTTALDLRQVTAGPTYTTRGSIQITAAGLNIAGVDGVTVTGTGASGIASLVAGANRVDVNDAVDTVSLAASVGLNLARGSETGAIVGYRGVSNGRSWIQAGSTTITTTAGGAGTVTFPTAFPGTPTSVVCCDGGIGLGVEYITMVFAKSSTNFQFQTRDHAGGFANAVSFKVEWIATYAA